MERNPLILDQSIQSLSVPQRFFAFANAYRSSSEALCRQMADSGSKNWPNAAVVLMTAAHATELFLKGMILGRTPGADLKNHNIDILARTYRDLYPEAEFRWDIPFQTEYLGFEESEIEKLILKQVAPSIRYRYPVAQDRSDWNGVSALRAKTFLPVLAELEATFQRLAANVA